MKEYVVGFALDSEHNIILIRKNRPDWQAGKLNGVGGQIEKGETSLQAMIREFYEETGHSIKKWDPLFALNSSTPVRSTIYFFRTFISKEQLDQISLAGGMTDELVVKRNVRSLLSTNLPLDSPKADHVILPNLIWMLPLAIYRSDIYDHFHVIEK